MGVLYLSLLLGVLWMVLLWVYAAVIAIGALWLSLLSQLGQYCMFMLKKPKNNIFIGLAGI